METKVCSKCKKEKPLSEYCPRATGKVKFSPVCKSCCAIINQEKKKYKDEWYQKNKKRIAEKQKEWKKSNRELYLKQKKESNKRAYERNKEHILEYKRQWSANNIEKKKESALNYYRRNKKKIREYACCYSKARCKSDPEYRLRKNLRSGVRYALRKGELKSGRTLSLIGCSVAYLKTHIESQFKEGMSWDNYGLHGWHIDHIYPCAAFDLTKESEQKLCFNYSNLQPMWAEENRSKQDKIISEKPNFVLEYETPKRKRKC
jgi:single-stranded DNA-specific DHH superfamily exonuclease